MSASNAPLYPQAILLPVLAFPSWILCLPPLYWHLRQGNIAAGSLILWAIILNFFNSINALIWPRDNLDEWWDGKGWCDINVRFQVGAIVGISISSIMIVRKLAKVMDTRNITVTSSRNNKLKEKAWQVLWCWGYPLLFIIIYYVVQPARYFIYGISGCISAVDTSWVTIVLIAMWAPITSLVAAGYALLLSYRLYRYRREFVRLITARNTTKSRFIRLFIICIIVIATYLPYSIWLMVDAAQYVTDSYSWSRVHDPATFNSIIKVPSFGSVSIGKWGQVATGYVVFFVFGTGNDAYKTYKKMSLAVGLGKVFPSLHIIHESGAATPSSFINARTWTESISSKAKGMFWSRSDSVADTLTASSRSGSVAMSSMQRLKPVVREVEVTQPAQPSFFKRCVGRTSKPPCELPLFVEKRSPSIPELIDDDENKAGLSPGVSAGAWASSQPSSTQGRGGNTVRVCHEVRLETTHGSIEICGNEQFILGRDPGLCRYTWPDDLTISRHHLQIHCILYESNPVSGIAPFVYATNLSVNGTYLKKSNGKCTGSQGSGILMGRRNTFLLDPGDELHISNTIHLVFDSFMPIKETDFTIIQAREKAMFADNFLITGRLLGQGGYGKVLIGVDQATQRQLACKMVALDHLYTQSHIPNLRLPTDPHEHKATARRKRWPTRVAACFREFDILKDLSHPNIVGIEKVFWSNNTIYIFQDLVTGGDLFSFLEYSGGRLDEAQAAVIIRQVLLGIEYLHSHGIVHRDLKPDNILMTSLDDGARVVITDFGNARYLPDSSKQNDEKLPKKCQRMFSTAGTLEYTAPEIHGMNPMIPADGGYTKSVDMWSIGTVTAALLTGELLFSDTEYTEHRSSPRGVIMSLAARCNLSMLDDEYHPWWNRVDILPKDFIKRLLVLDEDARMTASEALKHVWFADEEFDSLYARSLVERISRTLPDLRHVEIPRKPWNQDTVSQLSHPSEQQLTHNILQSLSESQHWRASSPLPSIRDDYVNADFPLVSPIVAPSDETDGNSVSQHYDFAADLSGKQRHDHNPDLTPQFDEYHQECNIGQGEQQSRVISQQEQFCNDLPKGIEAAVTRDDFEEYSQESTKSLNHVHDLAYSQYYHQPHIDHTAGKVPPEVVLVRETPPLADDDAEMMAEGRHGQTRYFQQHRDDLSPEGEQASIIVYETPPEVQRGQPHSDVDELVIYGRQWTGAAASVQYAWRTDDETENVYAQSKLRRH
ncbi:pheromone A receptor-domain-containing protein [Phaeosphaeria sp. MPI-PUGE-AT-0046c]|nr:pheromone A receptor-domain-containing protein [Phaeosphaeria sp. MPI-PUGE-AT-0046c]